MDQEGGSHSARNDHQSDHPSSNLYLFPVTHDPNTGTELPPIARFHGQSYGTGFYANPQHQNALSDQMGQMSISGGNDGGQHAHIQPQWYLPWVLVADNPVHPSQSQRSSQQNVQQTGGPFETEVPTSKKKKISAGKHLKLQLRFFYNVWSRKVPYMRNCTPQELADQFLRLQAGLRLQRAVGIILSQLFKKELSSEALKMFEQRLKLLWLEYYNRRANYIQSTGQADDSTEVAKRRRKFDAEKAIEAMGTTSDDLPDSKQVLAASEFNSIVVKKGLEITTIDSEQVNEMAKDFIRHAQLPGFTTKQELGEMLINYFKEVRPDFPPDYFDDLATFAQTLDAGVE